MWLRCGLLNQEEGSYPSTRPHLRVPEPSSLNGGTKVMLFFELCKQKSRFMKKKVGRCLLTTTDWRNLSILKGINPLSFLLWSCEPRQA